MMELVNEWFANEILIKVGINFRRDSTREKELMAALPLTGNTLYKTEMKYHGKFGPNIGRIQHISLMIRPDICYVICLLATQTVAPNNPGFQGIK